MFYTTDTNAHGLPHDPFKAIVAPRPIGWIGTRGGGGARNLAPYSFFNAIGGRPPFVLFSSSGMKDSARNAGETGVFTTSLVGRALAEKMNATSISAPAAFDEFDHAGLTAVDGNLVDAPYVGEAYAVLECRVTETFRLKTVDGAQTDDHVVIGQVVGIHIKDEAIRNGRLDMALVAPLARMGYMDYSDGADTFEMLRPRWKD